MSKQGSAEKVALTGDGLVAVASALGQHTEEQRCLNFPAENQFVASSLSHIELLRHPDVTSRLNVWMRG